MKKGQKHSKAIIANVWGNNHPLTSYFRVPFGCQGVDRHRKAGPVGIVLEGSWGCIPSSKYLLIQPMPNWGVCCMPHIWLVVWIMFIFPYIGNNHPNWLSYFSEGLKPPTRYKWVPTLLLNYSHHVYKPSGHYMYESSSLIEISWAIHTREPWRSWRPASLAPNLRHGDVTVTPSWRPCRDDLYPKKTSKFGSYSVLPRVVFKNTGWDMYPSDRGIQLNRFWWFEVTIFTGVQLWELVQFVGGIGWILMFQPLVHPGIWRRSWHRKVGNLGNLRFSGPSTVRHPFWHLRNFQGLTFTLTIHIFVHKWNPSQLCVNPYLWWFQSKISVIFT
jgi:hypothetical protein